LQLSYFSFDGFKVCADEARAEVRRYPTRLCCADEAHVKGRRYPTWLPDEKNYS
jgi:hypothetical protein